MKKKGGGSTVIFVLLFVAGLSLLLYPSIANYWNSMHATKTISSYSMSMESITADESQIMWQQAIDYNYRLSGSESVFKQDEELKQEYEELLNIGGSGVMGYIDIEKLDVTLPIYHGTSDGVLQVAVGHIDWSSLPVGGEGTHCVLSGHRGLPSAKLFTDLDELVPGDQFRLVILDNTLTYEVDRIRTVLPSDVEELTPVPGKDYCTLVTCTPYGINTHRLLVRGHRIENTGSDDARIVAEAVVVDPMIVAPFMAFPLLLLFLLRIFLKKPSRKPVKYYTGAKEV